MKGLREGVSGVDPQDVVDAFKNLDIPVGKPTEADAAVNQVMSKVGDVIDEPRVGGKASVRPTTRAFIDYPTE